MQEQSKQRTQADGSAEDHRENLREDHREDLRMEKRDTTDTFVELRWNSESGERLFEQCRAIDISEDGVAVECPEEVPIGSNVIMWAPAFHVAALAQVRYCNWRKSIFVLGLRFLARTTTAQTDPYAADHYEILRVSPRANPEAIERIYRNLAKRYHPDNQKTGDAEMFLRTTEAYRILSDRQRRAAYDDERARARATPRFELCPSELFSGILGEQNRRLAILCLLYRKRTSNYEHPGLSLLELEELTGYTREELGFSIWYNTEKGNIRASDNDYCLTAEGADFVEKKLEADRGQLLAIAAGTTPPQPSMTQVFASGVRPQQQ